MSVASRQISAGRSPCDAGERKILIVQGEYHVTGEQDVVLTTLLGSCVAACLRDPGLAIGGMNHFLVPGRDGDLEDGLPREAERYGVHLMELLVNGLLRLGARRERLEAKLFGGAQRWKASPILARGTLTSPSAFCGMKGFVWLPAVCAASVAGGFNIGLGPAAPAKFSSTPIRFHRREARRRRACPWAAAPSNSSDTRCLGAKT
jgi:CheD chemotactic sensory transduction